MIPPNGTRSFILRYQGYDGMSLESLLIFPGFFIVGFLNPIKEPSQTLGTDNTQKTNNKTNIVGKGTAADDYSSQLAKFTIKQIINTKQG